MGLSELLNSVSNTSLCNWFYIMFILNCVVAAIMLVRVIHMLSVTKAGLGLGSITLILAIVSVTIPLVNGAFFYALCDRSLNSGANTTTARY